MLNNIDNLNFDIPKFYTEVYNTVDNIEFFEDRRKEKCKDFLDDYIKNIQDIEFNYNLIVNNNCKSEIKNITIRYADITWDHLKSMIKKSEQIDIFKNICRNDEGDLICPCCGLIMEKDTDHEMTIEHILPKGEFKSFIFYPMNLVALCKNCNRNKKDKILKKNIYHPYYNTNHSFDSCRLIVKLKKRSKKNIGYSCTYYLDRKVDQRIREIFDLYNLQEIYEKRIYKDLIWDKYYPLLINKVSKLGKNLVKDSGRTQIELDLEDLEKHGKPTYENQLKKITLHEILNNFDEFFNAFIDD